VILAVAALGIDRGLPKQRDLALQTDRLESEIQRARADQTRDRDRIDLFAEVASKFPQTSARLDVLSSRSEAQRKDVTEAQASVQRLNREVLILRDALHRTQRDSERRIAELRAELEARIQQSTATRTAHDASASTIAH
jgi:hypothetical protein